MGGWTEEDRYVLAGFVLVLLISILLKSPSPAVLMTLSFLLYLTISLTVRSIWMKLKNKVK